MLKVLVTGASGLLGSTLVPYLKTQGYIVIQHASRHAGNVNVDLTDAPAAHAMLDTIRPDVIVNLVACTDVDKCETKPQKAYLLNTRTVEIISKWILNNQKKCHLIHISTDAVYDGEGPHSEKDIVLKNYYAFSKYAGELAAIPASATILRTNFFGPSLCSHRMSLSDWLHQSLSEKKNIKVFTDVYFSPLSMRSLIELISQMIIQRMPGIYNLGSNAGMNKADFAFELARVLQLPIASMERGVSSDIQFAAYRSKDMRMKLSNFETTFGFSLPTLQEEIERLAEA